MSGIARAPWLAASSFALVLGLALAAGDAHAFCRSVTVKEPPRYDVVANGCFEGSAGATVPYLYWRRACVSYSVQQDASVQAPFATATRIAATAFEGWARIDCGGGRVSIVGQDIGPATCTNVGYNSDAANQNLIVFRDTGWPEELPNTLALTWTTFHSTTGELVDADIEINASKERELSPSRPAPPGSFDLESILTHEAGHFFGLAHSQDTSSVMYALYAPGSLIGADDTAGICTIYPPDGSRTTRVGVVPAGPCDPVPEGGLGSGCRDPQRGTGDAGGGGGGGCTLAAHAPPSSWLAGLAVAALAVAAARRRRAGVVAGAGGLLALLLAAAPAAASVSLAVLYDDLLRQASAVAVVTPLEQRSAWEDGRIYTHTRVRVDTMAAGAAPAELWVRTRGGIVGELGQSVEGEAAFTVGHPALVFLRPRLRASGAFAAAYEVAERGQGQYPLVRDAAAGGWRLAAGRAGLLLPPPAGAGRGRLAHDVLAGERLADALAAIARTWRQARGR